MKKSWRQPEWFEEEKESEDKRGESEKHREKNWGRKTNIAPNWRMCFFGQKPISKISQGCKFHNVSDFVCSDEKEGDGKDKK